MYCPQCAAPIEGVKFCRACGANVSLVPQALSGRLPVAQPDDLDTRHHRRRRHRGHPSSSHNGISEAFVGLGFLVIAILLMRSGEGWGIWMFIPAFACLGKGIAQFMSAKSQPSLPAGGNVQAVPPVTQGGELRSPTTSELVPPPSIVEDTTRRFEPASRPADKNA